jgi:hypothetical protein
MNALRHLLTRVDDRAESCRPLSPAERMAQYSARHAVEIQQRENEGAAPARVRLIDGRPVLVALEGKPNSLPNKDNS